ncbi:MAG: acyltransferase, partial [Candidatus Edwardsbacteria bacterium]|nr:acyltransferase [Candidatus Edwardsbacteria bacterium]
MKLVKRITLRLYREIYFLKLSIMKTLFGIEYVSQEISRCPKQHIASLLRRYGASVGNGVNFKDNVQIDNASGDEDATGDFSNLNIGDKCYIGKGVFFDLPDKIIIEDECAISAGVKFITHEDCGKRIMSKWYPRQRGRIVVGSGSWIGVNAIILNGVVLGKCCVVAAGSVVTNSFPDYSVIAGMPAKVVKTLQT